MLRAIGEILTSVGEALGYIGSVTRPMVDPMINLYRRGWSFLRRYGRAFWAIRHDRSAYLLRFELGFLPTLTSWECDGRPPIYCWQMDTWSFEARNQVAPLHTLFGITPRREVHSCVTIPRPPAGASLWVYRPGDAVSNLTHYCWEDGQRLELSMERAELTLVEETLYGDQPVLVFQFQGALEPTSSPVSIRIDRYPLFPS